MNFQTFQTFCGSNMVKTLRYVLVMMARPQKAITNGEKKRDSRFTEIVEYL